MKKTLLIISTYAISTLTAAQLPDAATIEDLKARLKPSNQDLTRNKQTGLKDDGSIMLPENNKNMTQTKGKNVNFAKLAENIDFIFDTQLKIHKINPELIEKFPQVKREVAKNKRSLACKAQTLMTQTYRSLLPLKDIEGMVQEHMKSLIPRLQNALLQEWMTVVVADNKKKASDKTPSSALECSKKNLELFNQMAFLQG